MLQQDAMPDVSVLLSVHNGARYLEQAVLSVMRQTLTNIEIVVVDDCSTDETPDILARLAAEDPRIRVVRPAQNLRLARALNFGLEHVRAPYVARMDDDDICLPTRLDVQKAYLDAHPDVTLVGSSIEWIDADGRVLRRSVRGRDSFSIGWSVRFSLNVSHPTFMFRIDLPDGTPLRYDPDCSVSQDHELVSRLILCGTQVHCLPDVLLQYRTHPNATTRTKHNAQMQVAKRVCLEYQQKTLPTQVFAALAPLRECYFDFAPATRERIEGCFAGARAMVGNDIAAHPERAVWIRRQTAQLLAWSLRRGGASAATVALAFLRHGPDMLPAIALRALETKRLLPAALHSDPRVGATV